LLLAGAHNQVAANEPRTRFKVDESRGYILNPANKKSAETRQ